MGSYVGSTPPMNEYIGVLFNKIFITGHKLDQKFENIWKKITKKNPLHHHDQCLGLNTVENQ